MTRSCWMSCNFWSSANAAKFGVRKKRPRSRADVRPARNRRLARFFRSALLCAVGAGGSRLALAALVVALNSGIAVAQQSPLPAKQAPTATAPATTGSKAETSTTTSTWDQTKAMTRKEWDAAKKKWAMEKVKWQDCNRCLNSCDFAPIIPNLGLPCGSLQP